MHITRDTLNLSSLRKPQGHKYDHGHALVLSGGPGATGAARLCARGALRIGAGAVTLGVPPAAQLEVAVHSTAVMLMRIPDADALRSALSDDRINALCLGPGFGMGNRQRELIDVALQSGRTCVLDADALTLLAGDPDLRASLHAKSILTPHMGEFKRLFADVRADNQMALAIDAAAQSGAVVLLKGPVTAIAAPDGRVATHAATGNRAVPWLATAGAGDVLAGFMTGLVARGVSPFDAACMAAWLHVECAQSFGPGLIAEDLPEVLPAVLRDIL